MAAVIKWWIRIVKFDNGTYGIRRWWFGWEYLDITGYTLRIYASNDFSNNDKVWQDRKYTYFGACQHGNLQELQRYYEKIFLPPKKVIDYGKPV